VFEVPLTQVRRTFPALSAYQGFVQVAGFEVHEGNKP